MYHVETIIIPTSDRFITTYAFGVLPSSGFLILSQLCPLTMSSAGEHCEKKQKAIACSPLLSVTLFSCAFCGHGRGALRGRTCSSHFEPGQRCLPRMLC